MKTNFESLIKVTTKGPDGCINSIPLLLPFYYIRNKPQLLHPHHLYTQAFLKSHVWQSNPFLNKPRQVVTAVMLQHHLVSPSIHEKEPANQTNKSIEG